MSKKPLEKQIILFATKINNQTPKRTKEMVPSLTKPTFHKSPYDKTPVIVSIGQQKTMSQTAAIALQVCLRLAEDACVDLFNIKYIRSVNRKADMLTAYSIFASIDKRLRQAFGKEDYDEITQTVCEIADEMEHSVSAITNAFLTETVRKFDIVHAEPLAKTLTLSSIVRCADDLFSASCGIRSPKIKELSETLEAFANHIRVRPLNPGDMDINTDKPSELMRRFSEELIKKSANVKIIEIK